MPGGEMARGAHVTFCIALMDAHFKANQKQINTILDWRDF